MAQARLSRDRYEKKLAKVLSRADDEAFVQMVWAVDALQSERVAAAGEYLAFPAAAATADITAYLALRKWDLETLALRLLVTRKDKARTGLVHKTDCSKFATAATAVTLLRELENAESGMYLAHFDVLAEMHRIAQREFPWQRGYVTAPQFYRYAYIYGQGECAAYFAAQYGLTVNEFSLIGFAMFAGLENRPILARRFRMEKFGISDEKLEAALSLLSMRVADTRSQAAKLIADADQKHGSKMPVAYQPSLLRRFPIIAFGTGGERLRSPLRDLIASRITAGLYFDLVNGPSRLRNEAADRFERYCADYLAATLAKFQVARASQYQVQKNEIATPDILISGGGEVAVAVECKATKLTFAAQFSEDPASQAQREYGEISKGVFQVWRYFSHVRLGLVPNTKARPSARGLILTLDTWLSMSRGLMKSVLAEADMLPDKNGGIIADDRRPIVFANIQDLESILSTATEDEFLKGLALASEDEFAGWNLTGVFQKIADEDAARRPFPFPLGDVLPWWDATKAMTDQSRSGS